MCEKNYRIDTSGIEFDYTYEETRYRREKAIELAIQTIDKIISVNDIDQYEISIFYTDIIRVLLSRVRGDLESSQWWLKVSIEGGLAEP
jgi:hypothetical protein